MRIPVEPRDRIRPWRLAALLLVSETTVLATVPLMVSNGVALHRMFFAQKVDVKKKGFA